MIKYPLHSLTLPPLPEPPPDKIGWPWTTDLPEFPPTLPDGAPWPRISIVTPSLNQAQFLEETIRSVLLQGYPNLEYIIIDGGSTDGSLEIIKKYEPWLTYWVSEPDRGQSHAINKGFEQSTGEIMAWINSDDFYLADIFRDIVAIFSTHPEYDWIIGNLLIKSDGSRDGHLTCTAPEKSHFMGCLKSEYQINFRCNQAASFWKRSYFEKNRYLDERHHYAFDSEWFSRAILRNERPYLLEKDLAVFRLQPKSKTVKYKIQFQRDTANFLIFAAIQGKVRRWHSIKLALHYYRRFFKSTWGQRLYKKLV